MTFPVYLRVFGVSIHPHPFFETIAYLLGFQLYRWMRRHYGDKVSTSDRWTILAAGAVGALLGSKLLFLLEDPAQTAQVIRNPALIAQGKTIIGALLFGTIVVEIAKRFSGIRVRTGDIFAVPLCLGIAIGRIGCFLTGLTDNTYGVATSLPWGVDFGDGIRRHPTQLYEAAFALLLGAWLWRWLLRPHQQGDVFRGFMIGYMGFRLVVDFLKPYPHVFGMAVIQWAALAGVLMYARDLLRWLKGLRDAPLSPMPEEAHER